MRRSIPSPPPADDASSPEEGHAAISPLGLLACVLATLVAIPLLLTSAASGDRDDTAEQIEAVAPASESVATDPADADPAAEDETSTTDPSDDPGPARSQESANAVAQVGDDRDALLVALGVLGSAYGDAAARNDGVIDAVPQGSATGSTTTTAPPTTAPPTTEAPATTAAPTTAAPTTAAPTTAPPTTAAPTTTAPPATEAPTTEGPAAGASGEPTAEQWAALRMCESSNNYQIISSNGLYHGAYQFYQPTWDGVARQLGRTDLIGLPPSQAAPADQDALALALWRNRGPAPWPVCGRHLPQLP